MTFTIKWSSVVLQIQARVRMHRFEAVRASLFHALFSHAHALAIENTCARIDAQYIKRGSSSNHIESEGDVQAFLRSLNAYYFYLAAVRIHNECGPSANQLTPLELLQRDLAPQTRKLHVSALLGLPERLSNLEKYLDLYSGKLLLLCVCVCVHCNAG